MDFYNYHKILSYNATLNIIIAERGIGKSYGAKEFVIDKYKKKKEKFLYLRRYDNEIKSVFAKGFFLDIQSNVKYKNDVLSSKNKKFFINGECFGYARRMTEAQDLKSSSFDDVTTIIFDEYRNRKE